MEDKCLGRDAIYGGASLLGPGSHSRVDGTATCTSGRQEEFEQCRRFLSRRCTGSSTVACSMREGILGLPQEEDEKYRTVKSLMDKYLKQDSHVRFMLEKLGEAGCPFPPERITVTKCDAGVLGAYMPENPNVMLCYNNYQGKPEDIRNTILHELIHAYDNCRAKNMDFLNCKHLACTEVRAARLSGDCSMDMETKRGRLPVPGYEKACVKRRAQMSVATMPQCKLTAAAHVLSCLEACYQDLEPFTRPP